MSKNYRIFVEKKIGFRVEATNLQNEFNTNLNLKLKDLRLINVYDIFGFSESLLEKSLYNVFGEIVTDMVTQNLEFNHLPHLAVEFLPGQFDQRASSAIDCVRLIDPTADVVIKSSKLLIFDSDFADNQIDIIRKYYINSIESRQKDMSAIIETVQTQAKDVEILANFTDIKRSDFESFIQQYGLAMNANDLEEVVKYFKAEKRNPYEAELRILDTYWSDHCRHTTFTTVLQDIEVEPSLVSDKINNTIKLYHSIRYELKKEHKDISLMDIATIGARYLKSKGCLDDLEQSEENNACSIFIDVEVNSKVEKWLLMFKNETHNHPTEIEPFGGASTCLGGAIRDPLSGRSYVYQAMRITGAGDIYMPVAKTIEGKLPQLTISTKSAHGYSSYGNQIGLATTFVREIYHNNYVAKRLEVGAVVGAVKAENVRREQPEAGDIILMLGGRTGRDGIGGATGSSKEHTIESIETCSSEVQKGNAPEERKIQRLFRRPEVIRLIKKSNDFGAGGVSVAIGELANGLDIYLDNVKTKYSGLSGTELAISESQERMAVVLESKDQQLFTQYCQEENIEVVKIADVTNSNRLRIYHKTKKIVDISREFIDSAGAKHFAKAKINKIEEKNPFERHIVGKTIKEKIMNNLQDNNVLLQKGLIEMFDSTIGRSTVVMPFGGKTQRSETQVSVQKIPVGNGFTNTASIMSYGYNPFLSSWSEYHGSQYAVVESITKIVAAGGNYEKIRFSFQEYFEKMTAEPLVWGKPTASLLGGLQSQIDFGLASIGGKDSMSGTFGNINVPPMLMAFGITTIDARRVISTEFKQSGNFVYFIKHRYLNDYLPNVEQLKNIYRFVSQNIENKTIVSAYAIGFGGVCEAICKMSFGNEIGAKIDIDQNDLFCLGYGSLIVESVKRLNFEDAIFLGNTTDEKSVTVNGQTMTIDELYRANTEKFATVYCIK